MIKVIRHLFLVCVLLLSGYSQLTAHPYNLFSTVHHHGSDYTDLCSMPATEMLCVQPASIGNEKQNYAPTVSFFENEEDDEVGSFKKHLENGNQPVSLFYAHLLGYSSSENEKILPFYAYVSQVRSYRHLELQVFRI